jgi:hypothetical protein
LPGCRFGWPALLLRLLALLRALALSARPPVLALRPAGGSAGWLRRPPPLARARARSPSERLFCALPGRACELGAFRVAMDVLLCRGHAAAKLPARPALPI